MKIQCRDGAGGVAVIPEEPEDMWHTYNLILPGDYVRASTFRKVTRQSATGSTSSTKQRVTLTIDVEEINYDPSEVSIRLRGKNVEENPHVKMGAYHALDLTLDRKFELHKQCWDAIFLERLQEAVDSTKTADLAAVVM